MLSKTVHYTTFPLWSESPNLPFVRHLVKAKVAATMKINLEKAWNWTHRCVAKPFSPKTFRDFQRLENTYFVLSGRQAKAMLLPMN